MEGNSELIMLFVRLGVGMLLILAVIFVIAVITPKLAAWADKLTGRKPPLSGVDKAVRGLYDPQYPADSNTADTNSAENDNKGESKNG